MTIKDVAKKAGVAVSTVSRVLNGVEEKCASAEVKKRIWDAVRELGYVPNMSAKMLKKKTIDSDSIVVHIYHARQNLFVENSYFDYLCDKVQIECIKQGLKIGEIVKANEALDFVKRYSSTSRLEGLIILGRSENIPKELLQLFDKRITFITLNKVKIEHDQVLCDGTEATNMAMKFLLENGHKNIAYVGEINDEVRFVAYKNNILRANLDWSQKKYVKTVMTKKGGFKAAEELLSITPLPTAVFCANDVTALGLMEGLKAKGIRIPEDISIISIDNIKEAEQSSPALTTVEVPLKELGGLGVKILIDRIRKGHQVPLRVIVPLFFVKRESVKSLI